LKGGFRAVSHREDRPANSSHTKNEATQRGEVQCAGISNEKRRSPSRGALSRFLSLCEERDRDWLQKRRLWWNQASERGETNEVKLCNDEVLERLARNAFAQSLFSKLLTRWSDSMNAALKWHRRGVLASYVSGWNEQNFSFCDFSSVRRSL